MTALPKYKGVSIEFADGQVLVVPPLTLGNVEILQDRLNAFHGGLDKDSISLVIEATAMTLQRNYPDITIDQVKNELLDLSNMTDVMVAVMDVSGLARKAQEANEKEALSGKVKLTGTSFIFTW